MSDAPVVVSREGAVATVALNRPARRNALNSAMVEGLKAAIAELNHEDGVRALLLTGSGSDFCAGADLEQLERIAAGAGALDNVHDAQNLGDLFVRMRHSPKPIVAAVRGNALAGGAGLAAACDVVLAAESSVFGYPEVHLGFVPAMVMALLRRSLGEKMAFELVARGDRIDATEAHRIGLVTRVLPDAGFEQAAMQYATELATRSTSALALTKRLFYGMDGASFEEAVARGAEVNALARSTDDCRDGVRRFLERQHRT